MSDPISRLSSALADRYAIERELGQGGMATVYLAEDLKHHRKVAVKVLRPELAVVIGSERFLTEIRVTANLQHPHILPLHDSGEVDGFLFYVMPFVDGESLRDRLNRETQLSIEDALQISQEVADGLSHAHSLGVVHRDIKPENILLTGGHALIADFGIARAVTEAGGTRLTETGLSLGTPHYMSPEQASGERDVDARSDVYALGCVTYEMLVGEPPHTGPNAQAIIAKVLTEPVRSVRDTRELVSPQVDSAIKKALAKLAADRFATVSQFADGLSTTGAVAWEDTAKSAGVSSKERLWSKPLLLAWGLVGLLSVVVVALVLWPFGGASSSTDRVLRLVLDLAPAEEISIGAVGSESAAEADALAISADGRRIAFVGRQEGDAATHIFVRELDQFEARRLPETESASSPFFSPDGEWLGFYSWPDGRLKTVPISGGSPQVVCECEPILSAHWGPDGTIIMDSDGRLGLRVVAASGGAPDQITFRDRHQEEDEYVISHPHLLPDGEHVLFTAWGGGGATRRIGTLSLNDGERTTLLEDGWGPRYVESGFLVYQRTNQLWAVPFDIDGLQVLGTPVPILDSVFSAPFTTLYSVSQSGTLVYAPGPVPDVQTSIFFVDRSGQMDRIPTEAGTWTVWGPRLSPGGDRIAFWGADPSGISGGQGSSRIWLHDSARRSLQAITDPGPGDYWPIWEPDGRSVVFASFRGGGSLDLYRLSTDVSGAPEILFADDSDKQPYSWLPGGDGLVFQRQASPEDGFDIWLLRFTGNDTAVPVVQGPANETHPALSPDGRWLAYASDQSGKYEVYLRRYPELDRLQQVSSSGGMAPLWRSDSKELYFYSGAFQDGSATTFMRVPIDDGPGTPEQIWSHPSVFNTGLPYGSGYDVTPDGQRLLVSINEHEYPLFLPDLRIVFNWFEELASRFER
jgi:serine/threonine-protein kinase